MWLASSLWPLSYILFQKSIHISHHSLSLVICLRGLLSPFHFHFSRVWKNIWMFFWYCRGYSGYCLRFLLSLDSWKLAHLIFHFEVDFLILPLLCSPLLFPFFTLYKTPSLTAWAGSSRGSALWAEVWTLGPFCYKWAPSVPPCPYT